MTENLFIDSDILFSLFGINQEKQKRYKDKQTTGDEKLDFLLNEFKE